MAWLNILLKGKKVAGAIKSVKPFSKTGGKTVKEWKSAVTNKKFHDSIRAAGDQITGKLKKTAEGLEKLTKTLKKQKDIIDK
mgnify:FL=1|tara:strand:+ start:94 stop:339 length:246 start_codon:yes stop_codon:yes gene_type:complete